MRVPVSAPRLAEPLDAAAAWDELREPLLAFIARRTPDRDTAEDILQDVLLRIHRHADELEHSSAVRAWIFQIARNAIADHYRRAAVRREQPAGVDLARLEPPPAIESAPAELTQRARGLPAAAGAAARGALPRGARPDRARRPHPGRRGDPPRPVDVGHEIARPARPRAAARPAASAAARSSLTAATA